MGEDSEARRLAAIVFPDILEPVREDPRFPQLMREIQRQWGIEQGGNT